jgi:hypothetical protein
MIRRTLSRLRRLVARRADAPPFHPHYDLAVAAVRLDSLDARGTLAFAAGAGALANDPAARAYVEAASLEANDAITRGLPVYGVRTVPLRPGYPWQGAATPDAMPDVLRDVRPHRFAFVPRLALAVVGGVLPAAPLAALLEDWMRFARLQPALPYISNLVVTQRLLACTCAIAWLADVPAARAARQALMAIADADVAYLAPRLGDSYPNNHLLVDRFAAWFIAVVLDDACVPAQRTALETQWLAELRRQTHDDGGSFEHSSAYHAHATEAAAVYLTIKRALGETPDADASEHIGRMLVFQAELGGPGGQGARLGDGTEDRLVALDDAASPLAPSCREIHRALFGAALAPAAPGAPVEWAFWLLQGRLAPRETAAPARTLVSFPDSGVLLFSEPDGRTRCTFRTGAAPDLPLMPGHAHADLLSVTLVWQDQPILVDAGTYTYRFRDEPVEGGSVNWRRHFMGPHAHNGLVVGGADPLGVLRGDFRTDRDVSRVTLVASHGAETVAFAEARLEGQQGYPALRRGVVHLRGVGFVVYNVVPEGVPDRVRAPLQFAPDCEVQLSGTAALHVQSCGRSLALAWSGQLRSPQVVRGRIDPPGGWVAPAYGERVPAPRLQLELAGDAPLSALAIVDAGESRGLAVDVTQPSAHTRAIRICTARARHHVLIDLAPGTGRPVAWEIPFDGPLRRVSVPVQGEPGDVSSRTGEDNVRGGSKAPSADAFDAAQRAHSLHETS